MSNKHKGRRLSQERALELGRRQALELGRRQAGDQHNSVVGFLKYGEKMVGSIIVGYE